jgi:hypothetical protein
MRPRRSRRAPPRRGACGSYSWRASTRRTRSARAAVATCTTRLTPRLLSTRGKKVEGKVEEEVGVVGLEEEAGEEKAEEAAGSRGRVKPWGQRRAPSVTSASSASSARAARPRSTTSSTSRAAKSSRSNVTSGGADKHPNLFPLFPHVFFHTFRTRSTRKGTRGVQRSPSARVFTRAGGATPLATVCSYDPRRRSRGSPRSPRPTFFREKWWKNVLLFGALLVSESHKLVPRHSKVLFGRHKISKKYSSFKCSHARY